VTTVAALLDGVVEEAVVSVITEPVNLEMVAAAGADGTVDQLDTLARQLEALDVREAEIGTMLARGEITGAVLSSAQAEIANERAETQRQMRDTTASGAANIDPGALLNLAERWSDLDRQTRRDAIEVLVEKVTVSKAHRRTGNRFDPERVSIVWR
jgi:hypothetical protein